jgi:hypothetical protein
MNFDLGASAIDRLSSFVNSTFQNVASDKNVKAELVAKAISTITGIAPIVDNRNPNVTWVRMLPAHGDFFDAVFMDQAKKISKGPSAGQPANMKIDVMPALGPVIFKRFLPVTVGIVGGIFFLGYLYGKRKR